MYLLVKNIHVTTAVISLSLFLLRAYWLRTDSRLFRSVWVKVLPHANDTILLTCALFLLHTLHLSPVGQPWIAAKLLALVAYIGVGAVALRSSGTSRRQLVSTLVASAIFVYIAGVAVAHHPASWWLLI